MPSYQDAVAATWRLPSSGTEGAERLRALVAAATLAANSHNTQPWHFRIEDRRIAILPDTVRRCPVVDPDDHHLYASLGCAAENLAIAARALGLAPHIAYDEAADAVTVDLEPGTAENSPLFAAIPERQSTRADYDGKPVPSEDIDRLLATAGSDDVDLLLVTEPGRMETILEYVVAGNTVQMEDAAFMAELKEWIRFSEGEAVKAGDGLFAGASGNPTLPRWVASPLFNLFVNAESENDKYSSQIRSSAGLVLFTANGTGPRYWVEAGRSVQRFALQGTALGLRNAFLNQPVEVSTVRQQFADYLGLGDRRPDLLVRFGYGPTLPRSLRRPVDQVIV